MQSLAMDQKMHTRMHTRMHAAARALTLLTLLAASAVALGAQDVRIRTRPDGDRVVIRRSDTPMIGVTTAATSERADTLGLRIESVEKDSPAEKAGLKAGDRLQAVNGLNLRAAPADAGQEDYAGVLNRRLQREVQATKSGESVELRVLSGGAVRTVRVTPTSSADLMKRDTEGTFFRSASADRAALGLAVASTGTVRDTLGVFVQSVVRDGPAEKAGIIEGDRIAAIDGVSLRVAREDIADPAVAAARPDRLVQALAKLKAGDATELTVVTAGRSRTVRVTTVKASEIPGMDGNAFIFRRPEGGAEWAPFGGTGTIELRGLEGADRERLEERLREFMPRLQGLQGLRGLDGIRIARTVRTVI